MSTEPESGGAGFVEELIQGPVEHAAPLPKDNFDPWHKPRKHWIRQNQWEAEAGILIQKLDIRGKGRPLTYISLPGPDMLDVRAMQRVCNQNGTGLRFIGFMSGGAKEKTELNISLDEVVRLPGVSQNSTVVLDALQTLSDQKSVGHARAASAAPFDVVNIDLCKSIAGAPPLDEQEGCYDALSKIIELQLRKRPAEEPWILFLTTRANHQTVHAKARERFFDCLLHNIREHEEVNQAVSEALALDQDTLGALRAGKIGDAAPFEIAFAAAVSKWLLLLLANSAPSGTLELLPSSCVYGVRGPGMNDMLSLGFLCRTRIAPPADPVGLARPPQQDSAFPTEPQAASALIRRVPAMQNVDDILRASTDIYAQVSGEAADFMQRARFDPVKYLQWAASLPEAPNH